MMAMAELRLQPSVSTGGYEKVYDFLEATLQR